MVTSVNHLKYLFKNIYYCFLQDEVVWDLTVIVHTAAEMDVTWRDTFNPVTNQLF